MGVVDAQDPHSLVDPEQHDRQQLLPQLAPVLVFEVERIDVLVLLGWVLGVLDRAVGAVLEPLGVLARVGMIRRALERDVERHVEPMFGRRCDQVAEVVQRAQVRVDRFVAALR